MNNGNGAAGALGTPAAALVVTQTHSKPLPPTQDSTASLTSRELDVAREVARGKSDREIGRALTQIALYIARLAYLDDLAPRIGLTPNEARERETLRSKLR